jgi:tetratricopeptide (TPR) repeat protein
LGAALKLAEGAGNPALSGSILEFVGILALEDGRYREAVTSLLEARSIYERLDLRRAVALQDLHLGRAYLGEGQVPNAVAHLEAALDSIDVNHDAITRAHVLIELGKSYAAAGEDELAVQALAQGVQDACRLGLWHDEAIGRELLGRVWLGRGDENKAEPELQRASSISHVLGH